MYKLHITFASLILSCLRIATLKLQKLLNQCFPLSSSVCVCVCVTLLICYLMWPLVKTEVWLPSHISEMATGAVGGRDGCLEGDREYFVIEELRETKRLNVGGLRPLFIPDDTPVVCASSSIN